MTYECPRCSGSGWIECFSHVIGGKCFRCHGTGKVDRKPVVTIKWAVLGTDANGNRFHAYNTTGRTAKIAIERARTLWTRASTEWKNTVSLADAVAVPYDEFFANA